MGLFEVALGVIGRKKVFVSYHHKDEYYRNEFERLFGHLFINKSVKAGAINDANSAEYIGRVIADDYISDASVCAVLVGPSTYCRKHVDWEISAALNKKIGGYSGLVGILLPHHPDFVMNLYREGNIPARLYDNLESGYAKLYKWTTDAAYMQARVNEAFENRIGLKHLIRNSRPQMSRNICD